MDVQVPLRCTSVVFRFSKASKFFSPLQFSRGDSPPPRAPIFLSLSLPVLLQSSHPWLLKGPFCSSPSSRCWHPSWLLPHRRNVLPSATYGPQNKQEILQKKSASLCRFSVPLWTHGHKWLTCGTNHPKPEVKPDTGGKPHIQMDLFIGCAHAGELYRPNKERSSQEVL